MNANDDGKYPTMLIAHIIRSGQKASEVSDTRPATTLEKYKKGS